MIIKPRQHSVIYMSYHPSLHHLRLPLNCHDSAICKKGSTFSGLFKLSTQGCPSTACLHPQNVCLDLAIYKKTYI